MSRPLPTSEQAERYTVGVAIPPPHVLEQMAEQYGEDPETVASWFRHDVDEILTTEDVAKRLKISIDLARTLIRDGKISGRRVGREWRTTGRDLLAERVVSELLAAWWFPAEPITFADLAEQTRHLTTAEWSQEWADAPARSPLLSDQTAALQVVDLAATTAHASIASVSVVVDQDGQARSYVFDLEYSDGWRVAGLR